MIIDVHGHLVPPDLLAAIRKDSGRFASLRLVEDGGGLAIAFAGVPPTFVTAAEFTVFPQVMGDPNLGLDFTRVVHGSQEYVYERPLREGETLAVRARIDAIRTKATPGSSPS